LQLRNDCQFSPFQALVRGEGALASIELRAQRSDDYRVVVRDSSCFFLNNGEARRLHDVADKAPFVMPQLSREVQIFAFINEAQANRSFEQHKAIAAELT
jgi:hypothetical protein